MNNRRSPRRTNRPAAALTACFPAFVEPLERRQLLAAASVFRPPVPAPFVPTSNDVKDVKNGPMANAGSKLIDLYRDYRRFRNAGGKDSDYASPLLDNFAHTGSKIAVTVRGRGTLEELTNRLREAKAHWIRRNARWTVIDAYVPIALLHELARDPQIATITPISLPVRRQMGASNNQADFVLKADRVRDQFGLDGSGVTIGVLSDSVNRFDKRLAGSIATGDLPANVQILQDSPFLGADHPFGNSTDEGRAMLELIHDIAPGASLMFATAIGGQQVFADNIRALRLAGADIIVDDIGYGNEPYFQPGFIDQAITDIVQDGGIYLSAAGNDADSGFEMVIPGYVKRVRDRLVDFDPGPGVDTRLRLEGFGGGLVQWDNPYNGIVGAATTDLDFYFFDAANGRFLGSANDNNLRTGLPFEFIGFSGEVEMEIRVADSAPGAALPTRFRVLGLDLTEIEHEVVSRGTVLGHSGHADTISVGAVPFFQPTENEPFSSFGTVTLVFDAAGNRHSSPVTLLKPDVSAIDDVNTSFFGSDSPFDGDVLPNFGGTSAAAPNLAAVVAQIRQAAPSASQLEILDALMVTAIPLNGAEPGYDPQGGFGLVDAEAAIQQFISPPTVHIQAVNPDPRVDPIDNMKIVFSQKVLGFDQSDLVFSRDGSANLLTPSQTVETTDNGRSWLLRGMRDLTSTPGTYTLTLNAAGSNIVNTTIFTQPLANSASETFQVIPFPPVPATPSDLRVKFITHGEVRLRWVDNSDNEDRFLIERAEDAGFTLNRRSFTVGPNVTVFTDKSGGLDGGKKVFYRVRAINNFSEFQGTSNVAELTLPMPGEIFFDSIAGPRVQVNGAWNTVQDENAFGGSFLEDGNSGKGTKTVRFNPNIPQTQEYFVYAKWTRASNRATNVPYDVVFTNGRKQTVVLNQRNNGGDGWVLLGKFLFDKGTSGFVRVRTDGTNGVVSVDGLRLLPALGAT